jgi:glutamate synthase domain-containing protein 3
MSGGIAFVLDEAGDFADSLCNRASVDLERVFDPDDQYVLRGAIARHLEATESPRAQRILSNWAQMLPRFYKVYPHEYKRALLAARERQAVLDQQTAREQHARRQEAVNA